MDENFAHASPVGENPVREIARALCFPSFGLPLISSVLLAAICQAKNVFWTIRSLHGLLERGLYQNRTFTFIVTFNRIF